MVRKIKKKFNKYFKIVFIVHKFIDIGDSNMDDVAKAYCSYQDNLRDRKEWSSSYKYSVIFISENCGEWKYY
ncbi:hypothetical protein HZS_5992 [Henneguya salminicola]|nr:hypothetical protein HZS_5992 [Henneguya salminicola]